MLMERSGREAATGPHKGGEVGSRALRVLRGAVVGAAVGVAMHFVISPLIDNQCLIMCRLERAVVFCAMVGAVVVWGFGRRDAAREQGAGED